MKFKYIPNNTKVFGKIPVILFTGTCAIYVFNVAYTWMIGHVHDETKYKSIFKPFKVDLERGNKPQVHI